MPLTQNELSVLDLVASDVSYRPAAEFAGDAMKAPIFSYQDNAPEKEYGFPQALLSGLANSAGSPTAYVLDKDPVNGANFVVFPNWEFVRKFQDDENGFGAVVYRSKVLIDGRTHYIVALQGSDGTSAQDWLQDLDLAREAWKKESPEVTDFLVQGSLEFPGIVPSTGVIHFTGQSLGGGLAQYAAYDYVRQMKLSGKTLNPDTDVSLVTFNGFGAVKGLQDVAASRVEAFDPAILGKAPTYHYGITNDIVHNLGRAGGAAPGGSWHLNGLGNSYVLDFRRFTGGIDNRLEVAGRQNYLNLVDAHRTESGFYQGFDNYGLNFETAIGASANGHAVGTRRGFSYIDTGTIQGIGALVAHAFSRGGNATENEAYTRLVAGVAVATGTGPIQEVQALSDDILQALYNSGDINEAVRSGGKLAPVAGKVAFGGLLKTLGLSTPAGFIVTWFSTIFKFVTDASETEVVAEVNRELPANQQLQAQQASVAGDTQADAVLRLKLALRQGARFLEAADKQFAYPDDRERAVIDLIGAVAADSDPYFQSLIAGPDWLRKSLAYLQQKALDAGKRDQALVEFNLKVVSLIADDVATLGAQDAAFKAKADAALSEFLRTDFGKALANTNAEFTAKHTLDGANPFGATLSFDEYDRYRKALTQARDNPEFSNIRTLIDQALSVIDGAGERLLILPGTQPNPIVAGANPDTATAPNSTLAENATQTYTGYLPYEAGPGGQRVRFQLAGASNDSFAVVTGAAATQLDASGGFEIVIPEGQRQASFVLWQNKNISADSSLTLSATLLDAGGSPTHQTRTEATIALTAVDEGADAPTTTYTITGDQAAGPGSSTDAYGNIINGQPAPGRNDFLNGSPANDRIEALGGDDVVNAGAGDDHVLGGEGADALAGQDGADRIEGEAGRDFVLGGGGNDLILGQDGNDSLLAGNEGDDRIYGDAQADEATVFNSDTVTATAGSEWLDGGEGRDRLIGSSYDNVMLGGAGEDLLAGGAGADTLYGDRDAVITPPPPIVPGSTITVSVGEINPAGAADFLHGGGGDDLMFGEAGADTLLGAGGNDELQGDGATLPEALHGGDFLDGGDGDDRLFGQGGNDALFGGAGSDSLQGDDLTHAPGDDYLSGEEGEDTLVGAGGRDVLYGGAGNDQLFGDSDDTPIAEQLADELYGGEGDDTLQGYGGDDYLDAGVGNDPLVLGGLGKDRILGGAGNDTLTGDEGAANPDGGEADTIDGGAGDDQLFGQGGDDTLIGGAGIDTLQGGAGNDRLDGGADNDVLAGEAGADQLIGGEGDDTLLGEDGSLDVVGGDDRLEGGAGADRLFGEGGNDTLLGGAGGDQMAGGFGDDQMQGGEDNDLLQGDAGADTLLGEAGNDELQGGADNDSLDAGAGDDTLNGGPGNDVLIGGAGNDTYVYSGLIANGVDTIVDSTAGGDSNTLAFGFAYVPGAIRLGLGSLKIEIGVGNEIHIEGFDPDDPFASVAIDRFEFADRTLTYAEFLAGNRFQLRGTPQSDVLEGTVLDDRIEALESDDILLGKAGNDALVGGTGADLMAGGAGDDSYSVEDPADLVLENPGEGADTVNSELRTVTLAPNAENLNILGIGGTAAATGNDLDNVITLAPLIGDATLSGLGGEDVITGALGNDTLDGGAGDDALAGGFGDDVYFVDSDNDLVTEFLDSGTDRVFSSAVSFDLQPEVEHLTLIEGSGAISGVGNLLANTLTGNSGDNFLAGELQVTYAGVGPGVGADTLLGLGGNDELDGWVGDDALEGGEGDDLLYGRAGADTLAGGEGADLLDGSTLISIGFFGTTIVATDDGAIDTLVGGPGDDTYAIGDAEDLILESAGDGDDTVEAVIDYRLPANVENLLLTGEAPLVGEGNDEANILTDDTDFFDPFGRTELYGLAGDDVLENGTFLDGGEGADTMLGRPDTNTTYFVDNALDAVLDSGQIGTDEVFSSVTYTAPENVENLTLVGPDAIDGFGNTLGNRLTGNDAPNRLEDLQGVVFGGSQQPGFGDSLYGRGGDDTLIAAAGPSLLDGGAGVDLMQGGTEDDTYVVDEAADAIVENADEGFDVVLSTATYTLSEHVEELRLEGAAAIDGTGGDNALEFNRLVGNDAPNVLSGRAGADELIGNGGADTLDGGAGDDVYRVDELDTVIEAPGEGFDRVESAVTFTLGLNVEALALEGESEIWGFGNAEANVMTGNVAANLLSAFGGADSVDGGAGDDQIDGGDGDDELFGGADAADASGAAGGGDGGCVGDDCPPPGGGILPNADFILGGAGDDAINGGSGADELHGGEGDDFLYGGADGGVFDPFGGFLVLPNDDSLFGEAGDDVLDGGSGFDNLFGGEGADRLFGGTDFSDDFLDGGRGIDFMAGGPGGDTYFVDGSYEVETFAEVDECGEPFERQALAFVADTVFENPFEGTDTVYASVSYALPADVEDLFLQAPFGDPAAFADLQRFGMDGAGNALANRITGNLFANRLDGGAGADFLAGGFGDDTYVIDSSGDQISEAFGQGTDTVETTLQNTTLAANLENLSFLENGSSAFRTGGGNSSANAMRGSSGRENLVAFAGDDTLHGGGGNDFLQGGTGNDTYKFGPGDGVDAVIEFSGFDTVHFLGGIGREDLVFSAAGSDYVIQLVGTADKLILSDWLATPDRVDRLVFCDDTVLDQQGMLAALNRPPAVANPVPDQATLEDAAYVFTVAGDAFADPDPGDTLTLSASLAAGSALPGWLAFDAASRTFAGTPANADVGGYEIRLLAEDGRGGAAEDRFVLTVLNVNDAPVAADDAGAAIEDGGPVALVGALLLANDTDIDAGDALSVAGVDAVSAAGAVVSLVAGEVLYDIGGLFQSLGEGASATDSFGYRVADLAGAAASATVTIAVTGVNDAPLAAGDAAAVSEDGIVSAAGNVLENDSDVDAGTVLAVANPGTFAGSYGTLGLSADGAYAYTLDNASLAVQSLAEGAVAADAFTYEATDGIAAASGVLAVTVAGANDAPFLAAPLADQAGREGETLAFSLSAGAFADVDAGDALTYAATLADGAALPAWLGFDPASASFSGMPGLADGGTYRLLVTATDPHGAAASGELALDVLDSYAEGNRITGTAGPDVLNGLDGAGEVLDGRDGADRLIGGGGDDVYLVDETCFDDEDDDEHGNEGVGNDEDPPPPGHEENQNDGPGASPGHPGSRDRHAGGGGHRDDHDHHDDGHGHHAHHDDDDDHDDDDEHDDDEQCLVDEVIERPGGGYDTVFAAADYTLPTNVEALVLTGEEDLTGRGNALDNLLAGNSGDNLLAAGEGNDLYLYEPGGGEDTIEEAGGQDTLRFGAGIASEALRLKRRHVDLVVDLKGQDGSVTVKGWFASAAQRIERIEFADGTAWDERAIAEQLDKPPRHEGASESEAFWAGAQGQDEGGETSGAPGHGGGRGVQGKPEPERPIDWFGDRPERQYRFGFEAILEALEHSRAHRPLAPGEIARQWERVRAHAERLGALEEDEALRGAPLGWHSFSLWGLPSGGMNFGFEGSTGAARAPQEFKAFEGLKEGFEKL